jgi:hypothetical protein
MHFMASSSGFDRRPAAIIYEGTVQRPLTLRAL